MNVSSIDVQSWLLIKTPLTLGTLHCRGRKWMDRNFSTRSDPCQKDRQECFANKNRRWRVPPNRSWYGCCNERIWWFVGDHIIYHESIYLIGQNPLNRDLTNQWTLQVFSPVTLPLFVWIVRSVYFVHCPVQWSCYLPSALSSPVEVSCPHNIMRLTSIWHTRSISLYIVSERKPRNESEPNINNDVLVG